MKKAVITAYDISMARKAGLTAVTVPAGALVTPQAADDARTYGIALAAPGAVPDATASGARAARGGGMETAPLAAARQAIRPPGDGAGITEEVRRRVLARLGNAAPASLPALDAVISSVMAGSAGSSPGGEEAASGIRKAGGVRHVSPALLSRERPGAGLSAVRMEEAVPPGGTHPGITYMSWENSSFAWTFRHDEVLVVLEGEITLAADGTALLGKPGDSFLIPAGSAVTLTARGGARCVCSSWPNPAIVKG